MSGLYLGIAVLSALQNYVIGEELCGERHITGAVGGAVTLQVGHTGVRVISWSVGDKGAFATTYPGQSPDFLEARYKGRLSSTSDGSLIITKLKQEDRGTYRARYNKDDIVQTCSYHLTVFRNLTAEDITITPNVTDNKTCEVTLTCSVNGSDVTTTWRSLNVSYIDRTQNVVFVPPSHNNFTYICIANNPVSEASKVVHLREYCRGGDRLLADYSRVIRLVLSGCVLLSSCCIFLHHMKTEVISQRPGTGGI